MSRKKRAGKIKPRPVAPAAAAPFPAIGFVRLPQVLSVFPVSPSTWWAGIKLRKYPAPVKLGANTTAWRAEDIRRLIDDYAADKKAA